MLLSDNLPRNGVPYERRVDDNEFRHHGRPDDASGPSQPSLGAGSRFGDPDPRRSGAKYFANHHERSVGILQQLGYLSGRISVSRFNRRLHALADWMAFMPQTLGALWTQGEVFVLDSLPVPVCRRVRARRCRKVRGRIYCGYCAAKQEKFFGWRLQLVCTTEGVPVSFVLLPGSLHDLTPVHALLFGLPHGAKALGDKAFNSADDDASIQADTGVRLVSIRKINMEPNHWIDELELEHHRKGIETLNSQLESMGLQRLHPRTNQGLDLKVHATLVAVMTTNIN